MANSNARTGKYQALRRRAEIVEARHARYFDILAKAESSRDLKIHWAKQERLARAELNGLIKLGFIEETNGKAKRAKG